MDKTQCTEKLANLKVCILIPTYNNQATLKRVLDGVLDYTSSVIVVNDGSTDATKELLGSYATITQIHFPHNQGKGMALRKGFEMALSMGYEFAITIDSDGQHFPDDIPNFVLALEQANTKDLLLIGARNMSQSGVPKKSSFGNNFSNFWYKVETGINLNDTQSGFRLYPIHALKDMRFYTRKFEFEIEVLVRAAWGDIEVRNIPIQISYDAAERVSHFRPFRDFTRISILNTCLVFLTFIYIKPKRFFKKKNIRQFLVENVLGSKDSPRKKSLSIALGVFIGLSPFWGLQTPIVLFLAFLLRLNPLISFAFSNISIPPFIPFIVIASVQIGNLLLGSNISVDFTEFPNDLDMVTHLKTYITGSLSLGLMLGSLFGLSAYFILQFLEKRNRMTNG